MTALYVLAQEYRTDAEKLYDMELDDQTFADTLEGMAGSLELKVENVVMLARNLEVTAAAIKDAEAQMAARRKVMESRSASLKRYVLENMRFAGIQKIEGPLFKISVRENPPAVEVFEPGIIPMEFMTQPEPPPPAPNKTAIKAAIAAGIDVPGAKINRSTRLEIK